MTTVADAHKLAQEVAQAMYARDRAAQMLGMVVTKIAPGFATLRMHLREDMINGHHIGHGGIIFTLADTAFAYACNSYNANTVASGCSIDFLAPAKVGQELEAVASERYLSGRTGVYDVTVRTLNAQGQAEQTIALFRGKSARINGEVMAGLMNAPSQPNPNA